MGREMLNPVPVMTFLNKDRYATAVLFSEVFNEWVSSGVAVITQLRSL